METALFSFLRSIKSIKLWQLLVLVAILCVSGGATYQVYSRVAAPATVDLAENQQIIVVEYGDLINKVSTSGNLVYPERKALSFGSQGTVESILVEEGESVSTGQMLAQIDQAAVTAVALAVAQAKIDLEAAHEALDELLVPKGVQLAQIHEKVANDSVQVETAQRALVDYPLEYARDFALAQETRSVALLDLALAEDEVANFARDFEKQASAARLVKAEAQIAFDQAGDDLANLGQSTLTDLAQALQDVADANLALEEAKDVLGDFPSDYIQKLAQAKENEAQTRVALDAAQDALDAFTPDYNQELAAAQQDEAVAREAVRLAERALDRYENTNSRKVSLDRDRRDDLKGELAQVQANLSRLRSASANGVGGLGSLISKWEQSEAILVPKLADVLESLVGVEQLESDVQVSQANLADAILEVGHLISGPDPLQLMELEVGLELAQTNLDRSVQDLNVLESGSDPLLLRELEASVEVAQSALINSEQELAEIRKGPGLLRQEQLQASVSAAQIELSIAEETLEDIVNPAGAVGIDVFRARVTSLEDELAILKGSLADAGSNDLQQRVTGYEIKLSIARLNLAALEAGADPLELARREAGLLVAEAVLAQARFGLENLVGGPDPVEFALRQERLTLAEETLAESQAGLDDLLQGRDELEISLARAQLASAQQTLEDNLKRREDVTLKSPIDGFVANVRVLEGDQVNPNATVVELVDPSVVEVDGIVDEIDVLLVSVGTRALVTLDALPGQKLEGIVSQVAPAAQNQQGVVTFPIKVRLEVPQGVRLREGLTTVADIVLEEELNVLLVPQQALYGSFDQPLVRLVNSDDLLEDRSVVLGNGDDIWVAVKQGLKEGDRVAMEVAEVTTTGSGFRNLRGITRGGGSNRPSTRPSR